MSFPRHGEIYPCDEGTISRPCPRSSPWMSLQLVIPGRLLSSRARFRFTSRSYTAYHQPRPTMLRERTAKCRLTDCLSRGVQSSDFQCPVGKGKLQRCDPCRHAQYGLRVWRRLGEIEVRTDASNLDLASNYRISTTVTGFDRCNDVLWH
jgi:hypothetical protein